MRRSGQHGVERSLLAGAPAAVWRPQWALLTLPWTAALAPARPTDRSLEVARLSQPLPLRARVDPAVWAQMTAIPLTMFRPVAGAPLSEPSDVRLGYDPTRLYVAARFLTRTPDRVRNGSLTRDVSGASDVFRLVLDTFQDRENGVGFATAPSGNAIDFSVGGDGRSVDLSWNTFWDVRADFDSVGWYALLRIPWSSLRFAQTAASRWD